MVLPADWKNGSRKKLHSLLRFCCGVMLLLAAGCASLPDGTPPAGAVTQNPTGRVPLSFPEAVDRLVTEGSVAGLAAGFIPFSGIRTEGEPRSLLRAAARKLSAPENGFIRSDGPVLTLHGERHGNRVAVTFKADGRTAGRCEFLLKSK